MVDDWELKLGFRQMKQRKKKLSVLFFVFFYLHAGLHKQSDMKLAGKRRPCLSV